MTITAERAVLHPLHEVWLRKALAVVGLVGLGFCAAALCAVADVQFHVVRYECQRFLPGDGWAAWFFVLSVLLAVVVLSVLGASGTGIARGWFGACSRLWPLVLSAPLGFYLLVDERVPPFALGFPLIIGMGWAAFQSGISLPSWSARRWGHGLAVAWLVVLIALLTVVHTRIQINLFEHLSLGHADFGHFTEELKNVLAGRGLRCDSFDNTRLGWHFVPLLYVLAPGYALWPSPVYLMACSALFVHIVAVPAYFLARRLSGSVLVGFAWGVAWLLLPSMGRLVYSNTYGFQWIYVAMVLLGVMIAAGIVGRLRTCLVMVVLLLLCKETAAAATLGWGVYLALFTPRRRMGAAIAVISVIYFAFCVKFFIPQFSATGSYERLDLFGDLGNGLSGLAGSMFVRPDLFFGRLMRPEAVSFVLMLLVPMGLLPLLSWRILIAALPTLILVLLLQNEDWLSIKFWHQCTVLPFMFFAGIAAMRGRGSCPSADSSEECVERGGPEAISRSRFSFPIFLIYGSASPTPAAIRRGMAFGVLVCAAMGHYLYGFSPVSKGYSPYAAASFLHRPDPRMAIVRDFRKDVSRDHTILATERLAAHFTDYKRLYTGRRIRGTDYVLIDRADTHDTSGLPARAREFVENSDYRTYGEFGSIIVFERRSDAPSIELEP